MKKIVLVVGTTASGKSSLGIKLAQHFGGEIISADSRQIYKGLDIGSGKVTEQEQQQAKHHMLDIKEPSTHYSASEFQKDCYEKIEEISSRGKPVFIVGGTGFYTRAVAEGFGFSSQNNVQLKKQLESKTLEELTEMLKDAGGEIAQSDAQNKRRMMRAVELALSGGKRLPNNPQYEVLQLGVNFPREVLSARILERLEMRLSDGMLDEVKNLIANGTDPNFLISLGLEYRYITEYLQGKFKSFEAFKEKLFTEIKHFAKRQQTWFKKEKNIVWLNMEGNFEQEAIALTKKFLNL